MLLCLTQLSFGQSYSRDTIHPIFLGGFGLSLDFGSPEICIVGSRQYSLQQGRIDIFEKSSGNWQPLGLNNAVKTGIDYGDKYIEKVALNENF